jgi:hypothetical protein
MIRRVEGMFREKVRFSPIPCAVYRVLLIATQTIGGAMQATVAHAAVM